MAFTIRRPTGAPSFWEPATTPRPLPSMRSLSGGFRRAASDTPLPANCLSFILADGGGSNGSRCRAWKKALQDIICTPLGLKVTVSHYPPGTSKWNPIEHRLFSQISRNWAGEPLTDIDKALNFIRTATTKTGLVVTAQLIAENYDKGTRITDPEMLQLNLVPHDTLGRWNYTLHPKQTVK